MTYDAGSLSVDVGDVVRVPLQNREVVGFVVSAMREEADGERRLKILTERLDVPRAFDEVGLHLATFVADRYICGLGEALGAVVNTGAVPQMRDTLQLAKDARAERSRSSIAQGLLDILSQDFAGASDVQRLLRHPAARRLADRPALLRAVGQLVRCGDLHRERRLLDPRTSQYRIRTLFAGDMPVNGARAKALVAFVRQRVAGVPRSEAVLAGFSNAVIARTVKLGALTESDVVPQRERRDTATKPAHEPTAAQARALQELAKRLDERAFAELLLFGVTGSGKTYVYLETIKRVIASGGRAIVLVPEISLTPQTAAQFEAAFGNRVAVFHSALSERERYDAWQACRDGAVDVVVGARSAVFAPLRDVRMIVVDEAHETSYKQETVPRYRATAVARERMRLACGLLVLGSATPSLEMYAAALDGKIGLIELPSRATAMPMPSVEVVDLAQEFERGNRRVFAGALVQALAERLRAGEKSVLFVNRRGSARFVLCRSCGHVPQCSRCSVALAAHRSEALLRCHYCDFQTAIPRNCSACGGDAVKEFGIGTEAVAQEVIHLFPTARVLRMDSDTTTRVGDHARILRDFENQGDVLVGTQMIAKGLDYPSVTLAAVVAADIGLHVTDFRASERSFALIAQVCGRSGRARAGQAIVQSYAPTHPAIAFASQHDFAGFAQHEIGERRAAAYPPFRRLAYLGVIARSRSAAWRAANRYADALRAWGEAEVLGPAPYPIARRNGEWRFRIALKSVSAALLRTGIRERIVAMARNDGTTRLAIDIDP